jgi:hypothetical protein
MSAKLLDYRHVPPGFEMLIGDPEIETGRVWNLWFNTKLSDDPEAWDDEIRLANGMQAKLGELAMDHRLIRARMAEFCRVNPLFPQSIDILTREIGACRLSEPVSIGCEGRGLLKTLGHHVPQGISEKRKDMLGKYVRSISKWLEQGKPESLFESKVSGFLGRPTDAKKACAEQLLAAIDPEATSISSLKKLSRRLCIDTQGEATLEGAGRPLNCFSCDACSEQESGPACGCSYGMLVDAALVCVGASNEKRSAAGEFSRFIQESILAYSLAVNSWLQGGQAMPVDSVMTTSYVVGDLAKQLALSVHASLGERNDVKTWLAACLLKTIKDNQRWRKGAELIDGFPQAHSWFRN